jgi:hypothetical protein
MLDLLAEVKILDYKPVDTLIIQNLRLKEHSNDKPTNKERY